jgi:diguanylate cyclase (GGDEF)-like protein
MSKLKIGFLTVLEDQDNHSLMMSGVMEAASKYGVQIIRFSVQPCYEDYSRRSEDLQYVYNVIEAQNLDGLMFLGWMPGIVGPFFEEFQRRFKNIPLFSIGAQNDLVPGIHCNNADNMKSILEHLINVHGRRRIAFVAPTFPDKREQLYIDTMTSAGIYDENLLIRAEDLEGISIDDRAKTALSILIDRRKTRIDALFLVFGTDALGALKELKARGISVPGDVALISNEDSESAIFAIPALTVVSFPWRELGYYGCKKTVKILRGEPYDHDTAVAGHVIIRNSCGCHSNSVKLYEIDDREERLKSVDVRSQVLSLEDRLSDRFPISRFDIPTLSSALQKDLRERTRTEFLNEFEEEMADAVSRFPYRDTLDEIEDFIYYLRNQILLSIQDDRDKILILDDVMLKAVFLIRENFITIISHDNIEMKIIQQELHYIGQKLCSMFTIGKICSVLENNLHSLRIKSCSFYLSSDASGYPVQEVFEFLDGKRLNIANDPDHPGLISDRILESRPLVICQLLHIDKEYYGFVLFEPNILDARMYELLALHISSAVKGALIHEKLLSEISLREEKELQLSHHANHDSLTDLFNRRCYKRTLRHLINGISRSPAKKQRFSLLFIDFDDFKQVNDRYGHDTGDLLIIRIANKFRNLIRPYSIEMPRGIRELEDDTMSEAVFRLGGDEFTAIIGDYPIEQLEMIARELTYTCSLPYRIEGNEIQISCSVGISIYPDHATDADRLTKCADQAMYAAKAMKNMYCFYGLEPGARPES